MGESRRSDIQDRGAFLEGLRRARLDVALTFDLTPAKGTAGVRRLSNDNTSRRAASSYETVDSTSNIGCRRGARCMVGAQANGHRYA